MSVMKRVNIITILVVIFVVLLGVLYLKNEQNKELSFIQNQIKENQSEVKDVNVGSYYENHSIENTNQEIVDKNIIVKHQWGVQFLKTDQWDISENSDEKITLKRFYKGDLSDTLTIDYFEGEQISDSDAKFGNITYYYDLNLDQWMSVGNTGVGDDASVYTTSAKIISYTKDNFPIFNGVGRWRTFIIPLDHSHFMKIKITGSGDVKPLLALIKTIEIK